jgi:ribokinase
MDLAELGGPDDVREAVIELCSMGPQVVSLAAGEHGDLTVWREPGGRPRSPSPDWAASPAGPRGGDLAGGAGPGGR